MDIGIIDIKGSLPCFESFGNLPTKIIDENNTSEIKDLNMLIIPGGSLVESDSLNEKLKKHIIEFDGIILGICSGFQILSEKIDIGRKSPVPIIKEGLGLLNVEFSPLICTDEVNFELKNDTIFGKSYDAGKGFHCHTYGNVKITNKKTKELCISKIKKLNYKIVGDVDIISGAYHKNIFGTMVHGFLDNENIKENILNWLNIDENEREVIFKKNKDIMYKLKSKSIINTNANMVNVNTNKNSSFQSPSKENNEKKGLILLATGSESGKTFLTTSIVSKLNKKTFVAKIGPDVRDIVPSLYILREPMLKYSSIKIADRGWCDVDDFLKFVKNSDYTYYIIEGVMGAFTGALNKKNYSGAEISKILGFPVYVVSSCSKSGIEGAFVESFGYYSLLKDMGVNVKGIILNKVYNFEVFEKVKKIGDEIGLHIIGVGKAKMDKRGLMPEVEIDYENFCKNAMDLDIKLEIPKIEIDYNNKNNNNDNTKLEENHRISSLSASFREDKDFEYYLKKWINHYYF
ncbi:cobyrinic acid a,c-diamide synthase [Methanothermococcus sp.]|uniref:cobyrinic acid a,c-diamide synthase n=1 Tax=Methanothermococcus sp. TaxID=2614238 RepID=UPI0025DA457E|nr:cobyrinic acid a,c-diamide synthase [Methanothermococcus sp.]